VCVCGKDVYKALHSVGIYPNIPQNHVTPLTHYKIMFISWWTVYLLGDIALS
jgi:hypothetical protein